MIAVFVWKNTDFFSYAEAWPLIEGISRATWNYFSPDTPLITPRTDLPPQAQECATFAPPYGEVNLDDINAWRTRRPTKHRRQQPASATDVPPDGANTAQGVAA